MFILNINNIYHENKNYYYKHFFISNFLIQAQIVNPPQLCLGMIAPSFKTQSTLGQVNFPSDYFNKWKILFSHPADFTPVCSSEIIALADKQEEFKKLNTVLIVISIDGINSHIEWVKSLESIIRTNNPPIKINFPLISDSNLDV